MNKYTIWVVASMLISMPSCAPEVVKYQPQCVPSQEICNGIDDDCDGIIDGMTDTCSTTCAHGTQTCTDGVWSDCTAQSPSIEVCNGIDDDCDGVIDNIVYSPLGTCYPGKKEEVGVGSCRAGTSVCTGGEYVCSGYILPSVETCNGTDDNCNGAVDEGTSTRQLDIVFIIDNSKTMAPYMNAIRTTILNFKQKYQHNTNIHWSLVSAPAMTVGWSASITVEQDLSTLDVFLSSVENHTGATGSEYEAGWEAIYLVCDAYNRLNLDWRGGVKRVVYVFTDEAPQTYGILPPNGGPIFTVQRDDVVNACETTDTSVVGFLNPDSGPIDWHVASTIMRRLILSTDPEVLSAEIDRRLAEEICAQ